jgi:glycosyltransferase involved in cell wall biosynthesis
MSNRIRIVFVIPSLTRGGAERQLLDLVRGLDRTSFEPTLVLFDSDPQPDSYPIDSTVERILSLNIPAGGNFRLHRAPAMLVAATRLARLLRELRPDVLHTILPAAAMVGGIASRLTNVPVFIVGRRSMTDLYRRKGRFLTWLDRMPLQFASALVGNCEAITAEAAAIDHLDRGRVFTVYNGVDTGVFHQGAEPLLRQQLGFAPDDVVFGVIANFDAPKRHIDFVRAAQQLREPWRRAKFLMVGADRGELAYLQSEIRGQGMEDDFVIRPATREPERFYRALDVYVSASATEGMSNSILEAMASGKPVIATTVGGNPELVRNGSTGYLVPSYAPSAIATCAGVLMNDPALRVRVGENARRTVEQRFSTAAMVMASEELYTKLLAKAQPTVIAARRGEAECISCSPD